VFDLRCKPFRVTIGFVEHFRYKKVDAVREYIAIVLRNPHRKLTPVELHIICLKIEIDKIIIHGSPVSFVVIVYWAGVEMLR